MSETINSRLEERIRGARDYLCSRGRLLGTHELAEEYRSFRARFGPERIAALSAPELLEVVATRGEDSLVNWLEFEGRDDTPLFGDLRSDGEYCFGLWFDEGEKSWCRFKRPENIEDEPEPWRLTTQEAVDLIEGQRKQVLRAVDLVAALPAGGTDEVYLKLEVDLRKKAGCLLGSTWAHKYLSMCFPERLDQFQFYSQQCYVLLRCLQMPPLSKPAEASPYLCAGRFSRMSRDLEMPMNHLCLSLSFLFYPARAYWMLETNEEEWGEFAGQGCIDQPWPLVGDPSLHSLKEAVRWNQVFRARLKERHPDAGGRLALGHLHEITRQSREGDLIVAYEQGRVLGLAEITGPCCCDPSSDYLPRHPLRTLDVDLPDLPLGAFGSGVMYPAPAEPSVILAVEEALAKSDLVKPAMDPNGRAGWNE